VPGDLDCLSLPPGSDRALSGPDTGRRTGGAAGDWGLTCIPVDPLKIRHNHGLLEDSYYL